MTAAHRLLIALAIALAAALAGGAVPSGAGTSGPAGPRLAVVVKRLSGRTESAELLTIGPEGEAPRAIARESGRYLGGGLGDDEHPNWSPDGTELAFYGSGHETPAVYLQKVDGSPPRVLATSEHPGGADDATLSEPLFDPRNGEVVVAVVHTPNGEGLFGPEDRPTGKAGKIRTEFWALAADGSRARQLSSRTLSFKEPVIPYPASIAEDGTLAATALTRRAFAVVTVDPRSGAVHTVVPTTTQPEGSLEPAISPDGRRIVYKVDRFATNGSGPEGLISTDVLIVPTAGGKPKLLARIKGGARWPSWDPSGSRIVFTALNAAGEFDYPGPAEGSSLMEVNPDGRCLTKVYAVPHGSVSGAAWLPGAGAGPISC